MYGRKFNDSSLQETTSLKQLTFSAHSECRKDNQFEFMLLTFGQTQTFKNVTFLSVINNPYISIIIIPDDFSITNTIQISEFIIFEPVKFR